VRSESNIKGELILKFFTSKLLECDGVVAVVVPFVSVVVDVAVEERALLLIVITNGLVPPPEILRSIDRAPEAPTGDRIK